MSFFQMKRLKTLPLPQSNMRNLIVLSGLVGFLFFLLGVVQIMHLQFGDEILMGCILSATNAFLGYKFVNRAFSLSHKLFIVFSLAGMAFRFFMLIVSVALVLTMTDANAAAFVTSFMISYAITMFAEVFYINWRTDQLKAVPTR